MEFCVLIPQELSLATDGESVGPAAAFGQKHSKCVVVANCRLAKGTRFQPLQGTIRYGKMDLTLCSTVPSPSSLSVLHRYYDSVIDNRRHCNWIKFLTVTTEYSSEVNVICTNSEGESIYEVIRPIYPSVQLVVFYDDESDNEDDRERDYLRQQQHRQQQQLMDQVLELTPIDLSKGLIVNEETPPTTPSTPLTPLIPLHVPSGLPMNMNFGHRGRQASGTSAARNMLPCEVCGKAFDRPSLLRRHMRTHTGEKPHVCDICGKGFSTSSSLNTHRRIHSGEKPHQCPICGKRFTASSNLYYHRMTHTKDKPHKCQMCGKSFPTPGDLKAHAYIHNGHWPYKCSICNRGFSKQTNLKNHLFLHTGDKPHVCKICEKRFALACNLRAHLKTHQHNSNSNKCPPSASSTTSSSSSSSLAVEAIPVPTDNNNNTSNIPVSPETVNNCNPNNKSDDNNLQQFFLMTASLLAMKYRNT